MANLDLILRKLSEENFAEKLRMHDAARENFRLQKLMVENYEEFVKVIKAYLTHHKQEVGSKVNEEEAVSLAAAILDQGYSSEGGMKAAFYKSRAGVDGGLRRVVDTLCEALRSQAEDDIIQFVLKTEMDPTSWEEREALSQQYINRFKVFLPEGQKAMSAREMAPNLEKVLVLHMRKTAEFAPHIRGL